MVFKKLDETLTDGAGRTEDADRNLCHKLCERKNALRNFTRVGIYERAAELARSGRWTRYSSIRTAHSAAVGTATRAPTIPANVPPMINATITASGGRSTVVFITRGVRNAVSSWG